jgi:L-cystine uptake protein TcyP (sodium:dicarboxylate symporter family)
MAAPVYIISRVADPIFAVLMGISAAAVRINREEKEKGKTTSETIQTARRYVQGRGKP